MGRRILLFCTALVTACAGSVAVAHAGPPPPCAFTISPPQVEGATVVATIQVSVCAGGAAPYFIIACLQPAGGVNQCVQAHDADNARIALPYQAGVTYTATGRGCANWVFLPPSPGCQTLGPETATL